MFSAMLCLWPMEVDTAARVWNSSSAYLGSKAWLCLHNACAAVVRSNDSEPGFGTTSGIDISDPGAEQTQPLLQPRPPGQIRLDPKEQPAAGRLLEVHYCQGKAQQLARPQHIMCAPRMAQVKFTEQNSKAHNGKKEKKARRAKPVLEPVSADGDSKFARALGSTDYQTREKGLQALTLWMCARVDITEAEMLKIWKGLFFCFWHSDQASVQARTALKHSASDQFGSEQLWDQAFSELSACLTGPAGPAACRHTAKAQRQGAPTVPVF